MSDQHERCEHGGCEVCEGKIDTKALEFREEEQIREHGFFAHYVADGDHEFSNYHTHGFRKTWEHDDFQVVLRIDPQIVHSLFWCLADRVKAGERFSDGGSYDKIIKNHPVRMKKARECGRDVLRMILPDANGLFPGDPGVSPQYGYQDIAEKLEPDLYE